MRDNRSRITVYRLNHALRRLVLLLPVLLAPISIAQEVKLAKEKQQQIEAAAARFMAANSVPGLSVAVVENGEHAWSAGFGMADLENFVPATSQTLYRLASISKPITATAAMLLWQERKLDLDVPIEQYCPAFPQQGRCGYSSSGSGSRGWNSPLQVGFPG